MQHKFVPSTLVLFVLVTLTPLRAEQITIYRDTYGVPHIFAETEEGAAFGLGYAQAEDRLEQLLQNYRRAEGTLAEVAGGDENFQSDYLARLFRHAEISREKYATLDSKVRAVIEAFQGGVKAYMREHPDRVPEWAQEIHPWHAVALSRYIMWGWPQGEIHGDLRRGGIETKPPSYRGSNQWLIASQRSAAGVPIALIDPHLSWYGPFRFYECRAYGGDLQFSGMMIVGSPVLGLFHNRHLSVAMTTGGPDTADVYAEEIHPEKPDTYRYDGQWRRMKSRTETIGVREKNGVREVEVKFEFTHHGPIVARKEDQAFAAAISYAEEISLLEQAYRMITAGSLAEMKEALGMLQVMSQNIMVGTVQGDIYYLRNGRVPVRPAGFDFSRPVPGNTSKSEWLGIHPLSELIQVENPPQGYMQNCNVAPAFLMKNGPIKRADYQDRLYLYNDRDNLHQRGAMVLELLDRDNRVSVEDATEIALSTEVYKADLWQEWLRKAGSPETSPAVRLYDLILRWNRRSDANSVEATAYRYWKEALGSSLAPVVDPSELPGGTPDAEVLHDALAKGAERLVSHFGSLEVLFGQIYRIGRMGEGERDYPVGGGTLREFGMATPRAVSFRERPNHTYLGHAGQCATQLVVLSDPPHSYTALPLGQSDDPQSKHWDDQARRLFSTARLKPTYFLDREELLKHTQSKKELTFPPRAGE